MKDIVSVITDDHSMVREGLKQLIELEEWIRLLIKQLNGLKLLRSLR